MIQIRPLEERDIHEFIALMAHWGEPLALTPEVIWDQVRHCRTQVKGDVLLAFDEETNTRGPVGYIQLCEVSMVGFPPTVEITAILVRNDRRAEGIGSLLLSAADAWAKTRGRSRLLVTSQTFRQAAHRFYERHGFAKWKEAAFFQKTI